MVSTGLITEASGSVLRKLCSAIGKTSVLTTKPAVVKNLETAGLKYAPVLEGDVIQITAKPKIVKSYISKQTEDIAKYGEKQVERVGVTEAMLQKYTPHRRLSNKPCTLKNPKDYEYYIKKYEKEMGEEYLPTNWEKLTDAQKYDFIVKDRYSRVVSNKIMDNIYNLPKEHHYTLGADGEILTYDIGNKNRVYPKNMIKLIKSNSSNNKPKISIHNHPGFNKKALNYITKKDPEITQNFGASFSANDLENDIMNGFSSSYVVDSFGNKYKFIPKQSISGDYGIAFGVGIKYNDLWCDLKEKYVKPKQKDYIGNTALYIIKLAEYYKLIAPINDKFPAEKHLIENVLNVGKLELIKTKAKINYNNIPFELFEDKCKIIDTKEVVIEII